MTRDAYIEALFQTYTLVSCLREKNDYKVLRLRNRSTGQDLVLRSFPKHLDAYERLCGLCCDYLPEIYDCIDVADGQIVLEEYIDGLTVAQVMEAGRYRPLGAKKVIKGVCSGLHVLHQQGLVHRDVKPENVMVRKNGQVVLIDFNAARVMSAADKDTVVMGTVGYASPEQLGLAHSDARTDIYAVGVLLNVMLTGKHPTDAFAPGRIGRIIRKCTSLNPDDRYQSVSRLLDSL